MTEKQKCGQYSRAKGSRPGSAGCRRPAAAAALHGGQWACAAARSCAHCGLPAIRVPADCRAQRPPCWVYPQGNTGTQVPPKTFACFCALNTCLDKSLLVRVVYAEKASCYSQGSILTAHVSCVGFWQINLYETRPTVSAPSSSTALVLITGSHH